MAATRLTTALLASALVLAGCSDDTPRRDRPDPPDVSSPLWHADQVVWSDAPDDVAAIVSAGDSVVLVGRSGLVARDRATGEVAWETPLPDGAVVCGSAPASRDGVLAVLTGSGSSCSDVVALDAATGRTRWTAPIPTSLGPVRHAKVSLGAASVVVTGYCAGFARLDARTGALASVQRGDRCTTSSASDGATVVASRGARLTRFDAATGRRTAQARVPGVVRLGEVVSSDPLVVTALVDGSSPVGKGCALVDWSTGRPVVFGLREQPRSGTFGATWGCEVASAARVGNLLWLDDGSSVDGQDLTTHEPAPALLVGNARLLGATGQDLVVAEPAADESAHLVLSGVPDTSARTDLGPLVGPSGELVAPASLEPGSRVAVVDGTVIALLDDSVVAYPTTPPTSSQEER